MLFAGPTQLGFAKHGTPLPVPAGAVVAWTGAVADIPASWALCDGTNDTPDLTGKFVRATGDTFALGDTGGGNVTGSTSTDGLHDGSGAAGNRGTSRYASYARYADGDHSHTLNGTVDEPEHYTLAYIKAGQEALLPVGALAFTSTVKAVPNTGVYSDLGGKFIKAVADDARAAGGVASRSYSVGTSIAGSHTHGSGNWTDGGSNTQYSSGSAGQHEHGTITSGTLTDLPPYLAMRPLIIVNETGAYEGMVIAYDGDLAAIPAGWARYAPISDKFPVGEGDDLPLGQAGGVESIEINGAVPSVTVTHSHVQCCDGWQTAFSAPHTSLAWSHSHTFTGAVDVSPAFYCLHFIARVKP
jgi:hypothetical protein